MEGLRILMNDGVNQWEDSISNHLQEIKDKEEEPCQEPETPESPTTEPPTEIPTTILFDL